MATDPAAYVAALRSAHDRLAAFVARASEDDLRRTSMADEWTVAKVLSHLGSGAVLGLGNVTDTAIDAPQVWAHWDAKVPADMASGFVEADEDLVAWWEARTTEELAAVSVQLSWLPEPVGAEALLGMRLGEIALHEWDVVATFEPTATVAADATALLVDRQPGMVGRLAGFLPRELRPAVDTTVAVTTTGPSREFALVLGDSMSMSVGAPAHADAALSLPAEALLRLVAGRLKTGDAGAVATGALTLDDLRRAFPGF